MHQNHFGVIDLENEFYLIQFAEEVDYLCALTRGPWMLLGHCLAI